ncbi:protealysin propeptide domain-containing protein [Xenorhabdus littoralis]|uniref:protealysin propeptide domain-containing protein n=1 Tax=Xenorhabdus littoralis TaxID=2582835 RepID=UPI0029E82362|nr:protealysin propeptide domain-containing protein [Xenorhabdus sp. psl]MDX7990661.1 hypothetical protein [Xenorhabdus sp. psl]
MCKNETIKKNIIPPYLLEYISKNCDADDKKCIVNTLNHVNKMMKKSVKQQSHQHRDNSVINKDKTLPEPEKSNESCSGR